MYQGMYVLSNWIDKILLVSEIQEIIPTGYTTKMKEPANMNYKERCPYVFEALSYLREIKEERPAKRNDDHRLHRHPGIVRQCEQSGL